MNLCRNTRAYWALLQSEKMPKKIIGYVFFEGTENSAFLRTCYPKILDSNGNSQTFAFCAHETCHGDVEYMSIKVPLFKSQNTVGAEVLEPIREVLESGWLTNGPKTIEFERRFANYIGSKHGIATSSCTSALYYLWLA